jgi:hypothetical protein
MKALVVYESMFGNTEAIARAVADGLAGAFEVTLADVATIPSAEGMDLLIAGAPTHALGLSRPRTRLDAKRSGTLRPGAEEIGLREYLNVSPLLTGLPAATFDTHLAWLWIPGSAARAASRRLRSLGCRLLAPPAPFLVTGTAGPLLAGERGRAASWAAGVAALLSKEQHRV